MCWTQNYRWAVARDGVPAKRFYATSSDPIATEMILIFLHSGVLEDS